jgi:hypothetical protein
MPDDARQYPEQSCPHGVVLGTIQGFTILHRCSQCGEAALRDNERGLIATGLYAEAVKRSNSKHGNVWSSIAFEIASHIREGRYA